MSWERLNLASSEFAVDPEPPKWSGLIYAGKRHVISGPPESLKTLLALIVALEAMRSGAIVALIDFEMGPTGTRRMLVDLGATADELAAIYYVAPEAEPAAADIDAILDAGVVLAVIDAAAGAYDVSRLDDNKRKDAETFARIWTRQLWQAGVATIVNDHVTKNADSRGAFAIGSERKVGASDVHLGLEAVVPFGRGRSGLVKIRTHKDRPAYLTRPAAAELELHSDAETGAIHWGFRAAEQSAAGDTWRPTVLMEKVSRYLEQQSEPVSRNAVERNVTGMGKYLRAAMDALAADGYADESEGPRHARMLASSKPFRATSSNLVATSSDEDVDDLVSSSLPYRGDEVDVDEVDGLALDEVERLAALGKKLGLA